MTVDISEHPECTYRDERLLETLTEVDEAVRVLGGLRANLEAALNPVASEEDRQGGTFCARRNARMINDAFLATLRGVACTVESVANADAFGYVLEPPDAARAVTR